MDSLFGTSIVGRCTTSVSSNHSNSMECANEGCGRFLTSGRSMSVREGVREVILGEGDWGGRGEVRT